MGAEIKKVAYRRDLDDAHIPQVYDNPKQAGTVVVRFSHYKCLVVSPGDARLLADALETYLEESGHGR